MTLNESFGLLCRTDERQWMELAANTEVVKYICATPDQWAQIDRVFGPLDYDAIYLQVKVLMCCFMAAMARRGDLW